MSTMTNFETLGNQNLLQGIVHGQKTCFVPELYAEDVSQPCTSSYGSDCGDRFDEQPHQESFHLSTTTSYIPPRHCSNNNNTGAQSSSSLRSRDSKSSPTTDFAMDEEENLLDNLPVSYRDFELQEMNIKLERNQTSPLVRDDSPSQSSNCTSSEPPIPKEPEDLEVQFINESFEEQQKVSLMYQSGDLKSLFYLGSDQESSKNTTRSETNPSAERSSVERPDRLPYAKKLSQQDSNSSLSSHAFDQPRAETPRLKLPNQDFTPLLTPQSEALLVQRIVTETQQEISKRRVSEPLAVRPRNWIAESLTDAGPTDIVVNAKKNKPWKTKEERKKILSFEGHPMDDSKEVDMTPLLGPSEKYTAELAKHVVESLFTPGPTPNVAPPSPEEFLETLNKREARKVARNLDSVFMDAATISQICQQNAQLKAEEDLVQLEKLPDEPTIEKEEELDEDCWENFEDDKTFAKKMEDLKQKVDDCKISKKVIDYYAAPVDRVDRQIQELSHVLEVYNIPDKKTSDDIADALDYIGNSSAVIHWVNKRSALAVFSGPRQADDAMVMTKHAWMHLRSLANSSANVQNYAKENKQFLQPTAKNTVVRPKSNASVARRMVESALGKKSSVSKEQRLAERREVEDAKMAKKNAVSWED